MLKAFKLKRAIKYPQIKFKNKFVWILVMIVVGLFAFVFTQQKEKSFLQAEKEKVAEQLAETSSQLEQVKSDLDTFLQDDQVIRNNELETEIKHIQETYKNALTTYEDLVDLKDSTNDDVGKFDELFAKTLSLLSERKYEDASKTISELQDEIDNKQQEIAVAISTPAPAPESNTPPNAGYSRQTVNSDAGSFTVSLVAADIGSTRILVDTASNSDCGNDCPVLSLAEYISRNGAFAGINGTYFCPTSYPSCAGKTNSFDLLVMNKNKTYFNSDNNVYSSNPAVIFGENYIRFVASASEWGRDTSPNGVLSNYPLLVFNGNVVFGGDDDPKKGSKGARSFVANKGNTAYIGVVHNATVAESARALKALGMENGINLDNGGSTALWYSGYKVGPGRNLPNVILFTRK